MASDKLKPFLAKKEIYLAPSRDKVGKQMGEYLSEVLLKTKPVQPGQAKSRNEYRRLQLKNAKDKKEQERNQIHAPTRVNIGITMGKLPISQPKVGSARKKFKAQRLKECQEAAMHFQPEFWL